MKKQFFNMSKTLILIFAFALMAVVFCTIKVNAAVQNLELIVCNAGEDASTQMRFEWHAKANSSTFYYTLESDSEFKNATSVKVTGTYDDKVSFDYAEAQFFDFELELSDLTPNTRYIYYVKTAAAQSKIHTFQTSGTAGNFGFLWIGDYHAYSGGCNERVTYLEKMYNQFKTDGKDMSFVVGTGDNVSYGGTYADWQFAEQQLSLYKDSVFSTVPGNHDYYDAKGKYSSSTYADNRFFESRYNNPDNGLANNSKDSSYYFIYNSVLFIMIDCMAVQVSNSTLEKQKAWFGDVVEANEGKYQYIIAMQHYPWMNAFTGALSGPYGSNRNVWKEVFEKYNVDIALGGDYHVYYRSKKIYQDQVVADDSPVGTYYLGCPQIGDRYTDRDVDEDQNHDFFACRLHNNASKAGNDTWETINNGSGCTYFTVTPEGITGELMDMSLTIRDSYTIKAKRSVSWGDKKDSLASNIIFNYANNESVIDFNYSFADYIKQVKVYNGNDLLTTFVPKAGQAASVVLNNLDANKVYNLKLDVDFIDNTSASYNLIANTYGYFGSFDSFKANVVDSKVQLSWNQNLQYNIIDNYKVYADGKLIQTVASSINSIEVAKSEVNANTEFAIEGIASNGDVVFKKVVKYNVFGDANFDGAVDANDLSFLLQELRASYSFGANEVRLLDLNNDGKVDIGDALLLRKYNTGALQTINNEYYTVTVIDAYGNIISKQQVKCGENADLAEITDANFLYYSNSANYVTSDLLIKQVYSK